MMAQDQSKTRLHRRNINEPGHAHELTFSCYQGMPFFKSERACQWLADSIEQARVKLEFDLWAWVFMPEHVHLIVRPRQAKYNMAVIRRLIKEPVSRQAIAWMKEHAPDQLRRIERSRGQRKEYVFWQSGGGYDRNITEGGTLLKMIDYIHANPVRRGLVSEGQQWKWSSAAWYAGKGNSILVPDPVPPEWLSDIPLGP